MFAFGPPSVQSAGKRFPALFYFVNPTIIQDKLKQGLLDPAALLGQAKQFTPSAAFLDVGYLPFYYYLGSQVSANKVLQIGSVLGLVGASFLTACKVREWQVLELPNHPWPQNMVLSNLRRFGAGEVKVTPFSMFQPATLADIAFLSEMPDKDRCMECLELLWTNLRPEGILAVDYIRDNAMGACFERFCGVKNRTPVIFETRYGIGVLHR